MAELKSQPSSLRQYEKLRKGMTHYLLHLCRNVPIADFEFRRGNNLIETLQGTLAFDDIMNSKREMNNEELAGPLTDDGVRYYIGRICEKQNPVEKRSTYVFNLNTCDIQLPTSSYDNHIKLIENYNTFVGRHRPGDIFMKKYLFFPISRSNGASLIIVHNPMAAVRPVGGKRQGICTMIHFSTNFDENYWKYVVPNVLKLMHLLFHLFSPYNNYAGFEVESIDQRFRSFPPMKHFENEWQMLHGLNQFLRPDHSLKDWATIAQDIGLSRLQMIRGMTKMRKVLADDMYSFVEQNRENDVGHFLFAKRLAICEYRKQNDCVPDPIVIDDDEPFSSRDGEESIEVVEPEESVNFLPTAGTEKSQESANGKLGEPSTRAELEGLAILGDQVKQEICSPIVRRRAMGTTRHDSLRRRIKRRLN
ncbi:unnamed protein product [Caenorhabditis sp. 36 PRJEB53466]|nr:unnamed protein product [Caenorhabditis sp. 36 PRJEB53466]